MSIFEYFPDIPKPQKPIKLTRREVRLAPTSTEGNESFRWLHQKTNYLLEMMKFFPDFENLGYAGRTEDDEDAAQMWDQYGEIATAPEEEAQPGHFGDVERDITDSGAPYGYGMGEHFEEVHFTPNAGEFDHIDAERGGFAASAPYLLASEEPALAAISPELWAEVKDTLAAETRSYYELAMDDNGSLAGYSNKDAYLLMAGMLESRTRVWLTMEELFGSFNEADDEKRIALIDSWVKMAEQDLNPENISLLSVFLDAQQSFVSRVSAFYGGSTDGYLSYEDEQRIPAFFENLSAKVAAYRTELAAAGKNEQIQELDDLWALWTAPADDPDAYPNYGSYSWATTPGNILAAEGEEESRQVVDQVKGLLPAEYKGLRDTEVEIRRPDGTVFTGNPYDHIWGTHIRGVFQELLDKYVNQGLTASIIGRRQTSNYRSKEDEYDEKVWDRLMWEFAMERAQAKNQQEKAKQDQKVKAYNKERNNELRKVVGQAIAKKKAQQKGETMRSREKIKVHGQQGAKKTKKQLLTGLGASRKQVQKISAEGSKRRKEVYQKLFGAYQKRFQAAQRQRTQKFFGEQKMRVSARKAVTNKQAQRTREKISKKGSSMGN